MNLLRLIEGGSDRLVIPIGLRCHMKQVSIIFCRYGVERALVEAVLNCLDAHIALGRKRGDSGNYWHRRLAFGSLLAVGRG